MKWKRYGNYLVAFYQGPYGIAIFRLKNEDEEITMNKEQERWVMCDVKRENR